jgi:FixJ family two-component response regulator
MTSGGREIIVVDDDMSMSQAIDRLLAAAGLPARCVAAAEALLASGAAAGAAVLIFDIQLPGMSGLDLYRELAAGGHPPPVIFITGEDRQNARNQAIESGAVAYFTKPFAGHELLRAIRQYLPAA